MDTNSLVFEFSLYFVKRKKSQWFQVKPKSIWLVSKKTPNQIDINRNLKNGQFQITDIPHTYIISLFLFQFLNIFIQFPARIVLFGGANLEEETYPSSTLQQQQYSPAFRSRPPPFPSPSRPRPRSVAPEFHRRSTNIDYTEALTQDKAMTLSRSNLDRGPTQEGCNYFDFRPSTSLDYVPRSNFDHVPTYQRLNLDRRLERSSKWRLNLACA